MTTIVIGSERDQKNLNRLIESKKVTLENIQACANAGAAEGIKHWADELANINQHVGQIVLQNFIDTEQENVE